MEACLRLVCASVLIFIIVILPLVVISSWWSVVIVSPWRTISAVASTATSVTVSSVTSATSVTVSSTVSAVSEASSATSTTAVASSSLSSLHSIPWHSRSHGDASAPLFLVVQVLDRVLSSLLVVEDDEAEASGAARVTVRGDHGAHDAVLVELVLQSGVGDLPGQTANESLDFRWRCLVVRDGSEALVGWGVSWSWSWRRRSLLFWHTLIAHSDVCSTFGVYVCGLLFENVSVFLFFLSFR